MNVNTYVQAHCKLEFYVILAKKKKFSKKTFLRTTFHKWKRQFISMHEVSHHYVFNIREWEASFKMHSGKQHISV